MSQLRSFKSYNNVAPVLISTILTPPPTVTPATQGNNLVNMDGYAAAAGWFQLFDSVASPVGGTVPMKSINIAGAGNLPSLLTELGPIMFINGLWAAMSSTEATYTAVATSFDVWGEVEEWEYPLTLSGITTVATVNNQDSITVWADLVANAGLRLIKGNVVNNEGATVYLMLFALAAVANGMSPLQQWKITNGSTLVLRFEELFVYSQDMGVGPLAPGPVPHYGCTFWISTTPTVLTKSVANGCNFVNFSYR